LATSHYELILSTFCRESTELYAATTVQTPESHHSPRISCRGCGVIHHLNHTVVETSSPCERVMASLLMWSPLTRTV